MAGTPAQNGNSAAGNSDFTRRAETLAKAMMWGTPVANDDNKSPQAHLAMKARMKGGPRNTVTSLQVQARMWTTPQAHDVSPRGSGQIPTAAAGNACLATDAQQFPTPASRDHRSPNTTPFKTRGGENKGERLPNFIAHSFTHPAPKPTTFGRLSFETRRNLLRLLAEAGFFKRPKRIGRPYSEPTRRNPRDAARAHWRRYRSYERWEHRRRTWMARRLNVLFVEWLMGWPPGHALCDCSATAFAHWSQAMRGALCQQPTALAAWIWKPPVPKPAPKQGSLF
ncbi:hypothetical protein JANAI62_03500 [Jannaschia pagri]|uniref:Uncharacterized protein n=1 Tax=Jannaschia pagri TaxID=2829797 RepID=A0ABQ4NH20_9RHOB|nr:MULTISPECIES: hypothetical protein [unclassified Jannaschia]GIT90167.1 hypothetical protein JANAI61_06250 [Jannaschia sp. AI_61]GIT93727.1 hypothetical protein JANAI62_03500 [Jannaschia sp. AI_62]